MFKKSHPLQSKSEIILRNIVVLAMVVFFIVFLIIPIGIAFAGSFHEWNPLSGTYKFWVWKIISRCSRANCSPNQCSIQ